MRKAICYIVGNNIIGTVIFMQDNMDSNVNIMGTITGLSEGYHGMHIHEFGDVYDKCMNTGEHFNPFNKNHGSPESIDRHVGDLGNIYSDSSNVSNIKKIDNLITLFGDYSILGRSLVVHSNRDDLGLGNNRDSKISGNSGNKVACGSIVICKNDV